MKCPYSIKLPGLKISRKSLLNVPDDLTFAKMNTLTVQSRALQICIFTINLLVLFGLPIKIYETKNNLICSLKLFLFMALFEHSWNTMIYKSVTDNLMIENWTMRGQNQTSEVLTGFLEVRRFFFVESWRTIIGGVLNLRLDRRFDDRRFDDRRLEQRRQLAQWRLLDQRRLERLDQLDRSTSRPTQLFSISTSTNCWNGNETYLQRMKNIE